MSIISGQFPKELKCAKIVPIYKNKLKTDPGNYRPVSILSRQALLWLHVNDQLVINCNDSRRPCIMLVIV